MSRPADAIMPLYHSTQEDSFTKITMKIRNYAFTGATIIYNRKQKVKFMASCTGSKNSKSDSETKVQYFCCYQAAVQLGKNDREAGHPQN